MVGLWGVGGGERWVVVVVVGGGRWMVVVMVEVGDDGGEGEGGIWALGVGSSIVTAPDLGISVASGLLLAAVSLGDSRVRGAEGEEAKEDLSMILVWVLEERVVNESGSAYAV